MKSSKPSKIAGKKCLVCGDKASAYNFFGLSCESCKVFFRRNCGKCLTDLICDNANRCQITVATRRNCTKCRLVRCFQIGMKKELVKSRADRLDSNQENIQPNNADLLLLEQYLAREEAIFYTPAALNAHELEQISEISSAMAYFANEQSMPVITQLNHFMDAFSLYGRYTRKIVKFCKNIASFKNLQQNDQLAILKPFHSEIISIRTAFLYDPARDGFVILLNDWEEKVAFVPLSCYRTCRVYDLETYCRHFLSMLNLIMDNDPVLRDLIIAQKLFDLRTNVPLSCPQFIRNQNLVYVRLIRRYLGHRWQNYQLAEQKFTTLMTLLADLAVIREKNRRVYHEIGQTKPEKVDEALLEFYELKT